MIIECNAGKKDLEYFAELISTKVSTKAQYILIRAIPPNRNLLITPENNNWNLDYFSYTKHERVENVSTSELHKMLKDMALQLTSIEKNHSWKKVDKPRPFANRILGLQADSSFSIEVGEDEIDVPSPSTTLYGDDDEPPVLDKLLELLPLLIDKKSRDPKRYVFEVLNLLQKNEEVLTTNEKELISVLLNVDDLLGNFAEIGSKELDLLVKELRRIATNYKGEKSETLTEVIESMEAEINEAQSM